MVSPSLFTRRSPTERVPFLGTPHTDLCAAHTGNAIPYAIAWGWVARIVAASTGVAVSPTSGHRARGSMTFVQSQPDRIPQGVQRLRGGAGGVNDERDHVHLLVHYRPKVAASSWSTASRAPPPAGYARSFTGQINRAVRTGTCGHPRTSPHHAAEHCCRSSTSTSSSKTSAPRCTSEQAWDASSPV